MLLLDTVASHTRHNALSALKTKRQKFKMCLVAAMGKTIQILVAVTASRVSLKDQPKNYPNNARCCEQQLKKDGNLTQRFVRPISWPVVRTLK